MKRLPLFLVRTVCMHFQFGFLEISIQFTGKKIQRVEHSTSKCRPNSSVPQNNVAHGEFVLGKQRVKCKLALFDSYSVFICNAYITFLIIKTSQNQEKMCCQFEYRLRISCLTINIWSVWRRWVKTKQRRVPVH